MFYFIKRVQQVVFIFQALMAITEQKTQNSLAIVDVFSRHVGAKAILDERAETVVSNTIELEISVCWTHGVSGLIRKTKLIWRCKKGSDRHVVLWLNIDVLSRFERCTQNRRRMEQSFGYRRCLIHIRREQGSGWAGYLSLPQIQHGSGLYHKYSLNISKRWSERV